MPDIKQVFNEEIRRLARKELKNSLLPMAKQIADLKKQIAGLKKQIAGLEKVSAEIKPVKAVCVDAIDPEEKILRLNAAGILRIRTKLQLSQSELAKLVGVSGHTVSLWEIGRVSPREQTKKAICALRRMGKRELKKRLAEAGISTEK